MRKVGKKRQNVSENVGKQEPSNQLTCQQSGPREHHSPETQGATVLGSSGAVSLVLGQEWHGTISSGSLSAAVNELPGYL